VGRFDIDEGAYERDDANCATCTSLVQLPGSQATPQRLCVKGKWHENKETVLACWK